MQQVFLKRGKRGKAQLFASLAYADQADQTMDVLQTRRNGHKERGADDRGMRLDGKYFRTKKIAAPGAGSTGKNEPSGLSTENPVKNKLRP